MMKHAMCVEAWSDGDLLLVYTNTSYLRHLPPPATQQVAPPFGEAMKGLFRKSYLFSAIQAPQTAPASRMSSSRSRCFRSKCPLIARPPGGTMPASGPSVLVLV